MHTKLRGQGWVAFALRAAALALSACGAKDAEVVPAGDMGAGGVGGQNAGGEVTPGGSGGQGLGGEVMPGGSGGSGGQPVGGEEPPVDEGLANGSECEIPVDCTRESPDFEDCIQGGCRSGNCVTGFGRFGYCSRDCEADQACENFVPGTSGSGFTCVQDETSGQCMPGSNARCDGARNGACEDPNEACTFAQTFSADGTYGGVCQPVLEGGAATNEPCDEDAGVRCANGMCLLGRCRTFCDPEAEEGPCDAAHSVCFNDFSLGEGSVLLDMCLPKYCERSADCDEGSVCGVALDFGGNPYIVGVCIPSDPAMPSLGEACVPGESSCDGGNFCLGEEGEYCSAFCDVDADCGDAGYCTVISVGLDAETGQTAQAQICAPGRAGSGRDCETNADCIAEGENALEACDIVLRGDVQGGRPVVPAFVTGRCVSIPEAAVAPGEACSDEAPCRTENLCLDGYCSQLCRQSADCGAGALCASVTYSTNDTNDPGDDLYGRLCVADAGSHDPCAGDAECVAGSEFCSVNLLLGGEQTEVEQFCAASDGGAGLAGATCGGDQDCAGGRCLAWSRRIGELGYCSGVCVVDADCASGATCEDVVLFGGAAADATDDLLGKICVQTHECATCDFGGGRICGGDLVCSLLSFAADRTGGACLTPCADGGPACPAGSACSEARNAQGEIIAGTSVCTPNIPRDTCDAARPR